MERREFVFRQIVLYIGNIERWSQSDMVCIRGW